MKLNDYFPQIEEVVERALEEDSASGDITSYILLSPHVKAQACVISKADGILAGIEVAKLVFLTADPFLEFKSIVEDGSKIQPRDILATIEGPARSILKGERTSLNFLQHLSGIATTTSHYVDAVKGLPVQILDTRKTIPGLRILEKYAVHAGGGYNHRMNLSDMVLIKDNHIAVMRKQGLGIKEIVQKTRQKAAKGIKIEIETTNPEDAAQAAEAGADIIMLDNMTLDDMRRAVEMIGHHAIVEASGGVNLNTVRAIAETGVDWISIGALTHSANALDISLELKI
ncbi:MAG: carboxylating nicotinate-nucleotide diphosphorylase [Dehalococcoidia bacterium]|nr:carboxylating nicotinate-nucleotide diphosphorylase [Dehalococcoidia bacterium]MDD5493266.1 carboxylating nicotinate-nucleotide diphosphorylase [Dehalococcoidia bacterium]